MIDVSTDWWIALLIAAVGGAAGGLVFELLRVRGGDNGMLEWPSRHRDESASRTYRDLGFPASLIIGAVAAMGFLYFLPPELSVAVDGEDAATTSRLYDAPKLVAGSLIVGSGGPAFVQGLQDRLMKVINSVHVNTLVAAIAASQPAANPIGQGVRNPTADEQIQDLTARLAALEAIAEAARRSARS